MKQTTKELIQASKNQIAILEAQNVEARALIVRINKLSKKEGLVQLNSTQPQLYDLWKNEQNIEKPKGIFRKSCPKCRQQLTCQRYKAGEIGDAILEYFYYSCHCGYEYCLMKAFAKLLHKSKALVLGGKG